MNVVERESAPSGGAPGRLLRTAGNANSSAVVQPSMPRSGLRRPVMTEITTSTSVSEINAATPAMNQVNTTTGSNRASDSLTTRSPTSDCRSSRGVTCIA